LVRNKQPKTPPKLEVEGKPVLTGICPECVARYVLLAVRDPLGFKRDAAEEIASYFDSAKKVADTGMFITYSGEYRGVPVTVCSTGSGAPDTEIAFMDFIQYSAADTFIRVGTSGSYHPAVRVGDVVISSGAVRDDGTSREYVKTSYPAVASHEVVLALSDAAEEVGASYHIGITRSNDSIYCGQGRPVKDYMQDEHLAIPDYWRRAGVMNVERETSIILTLSNLFHVRGGSVCAVVNSTPHGYLDVSAGVQDAIRTALEGIRRLNHWDAQVKKSGKKWWTPSLLQG